MHEGSDKLDRTARITVGHDVHLWSLLTELVENTGEFWQREGVPDPHSHRPAYPAVHRTDHVTCGIDGGQHLSSFGEKGRTRIGELDGSSRAAKECGAEFSLQRLHRRGESRLHNVHLLRRASEISRVSDRDKMLYLSQLHA